MEKHIDFDALIKEQPSRKSKTGSILTWAGNLPAEALGMILSMASREAGGFGKNILKLLGETDIGKWFKKFFVGYGHKSIGDCGFTAFAIDKASILSAVAFEHHALFSGAETSTRYVDVTGLDYHVPQEDPKLHDMMKECFQMYRDCLEPLVDHMRKKYPYEDGWNPDTYETTVRTKALDVLGSLLPAGARTNYSVVMNLRQTRDHLSTLRYNPLVEIADLAETAILLMQDQHPGAFAGMNYDLDDPKNAEKKERDDYRRRCMRVAYYENVRWEIPAFDSKELGTMMFQNTYQELYSLLAERPKGVELPDRLNRGADFIGNYQIDFRSFRDLHRHRSMKQSMPLLTVEHGFEEWYLDQMPLDMRDKVVSWLDGYKYRLVGMDSMSSIDKQYLIPMGYKVGVEFSVGLAHLVYIIELRSQQTVHPTVRRVVQSWARQLADMLPNMKLYANMDPDKFDIKRGSQTIIEKKEVK